jgi:hypothetical protein
MEVIVMSLFNWGHSKDRAQNTEHDDGHCHGCKWWQGQAKGTSDRVSLGLCMHAELVHFNLEVSGDSSCNRFEPLPAMAGAEAEAIPAMMPAFA